jgi:anaphase-promoting complex subunit 8
MTIVSFSFSKFHDFRCRDPLERTAMRNGNLNQLLREMHIFYKRGRLDAFGLHVYGMVLKEAEKSPAPKASSSPLSVIYQHGIEMPSAQRIIIQSLISYPYNWSAWLDLVELCETDPSIHSEVQELLEPISSHWMYHFFCVHLFLAKEANEDALVIIEQLIHGTDGYGLFVSSPYLQYQIAIAHYNMMDYETANGHFRLLIERDPQRLDQIDVYSNILYVKDDKVSLSSLAHRAMKLDKYRPETCCIVGNYYSLKGQHEKAVQYFQRALKLDRSYLSAWTLMGHEYIEMKNSAAAIEAYRRAVDINPRDYRAWYGLGQTYEIMGMLLYALFYFRKAVELRPHDPRMWCAIGGCYYGLDRRNDAIRSYERAVSKNDVEGIATRKLAMLYCEDGNTEKAARCYLRHLNLRYQAQIAQQQTPASSDVDYYQIISSVNVDEPEAEGLLYLASYYRDHEEYDMAMLCCSRLLDFPGPEKEEGKALQREIRTVIDNQASGRATQDDDDMDEEETFDLSD